MEEKAEARTEGKGHLCPTSGARSWGAEEGAKVRAIGKVMEARHGQGLWAWAGERGSGHSHVGKAGVASPKWQGLEANAEMWGQVAGP